MKLLPLLICLLIPDIGSCKTIIIDHIRVHDYRIKTIARHSGKIVLPKHLLEIVEIASLKHGVDKNLIHAVIQVESGGNNRAISPKNAQGLMQLIPDTQKRFGVKDPYDPVQNINGGTKYLKWLLTRYNGNVILAIAGYNAGEGAVDKYNRNIPPYIETKNYVKQVLIRIQ